MPQIKFQAGRSGYMRAVSQDHNMRTQKDQKEGQERKEERQQERLKYTESWEKGGRKRGEVKKGGEERGSEEGRKERIREIMLNAKQEKRKTALTSYILEQAQLSLDQYRPTLHGLPYAQTFFSKHIQDGTICVWLSLRLQDRGFRGPWSIYWFSRSWGSRTIPHRFQVMLAMWPLIKSIKWEEWGLDINNMIHSILFSAFLGML